MRSLQFLVLGFLLACVSGCGSARAGDKCSTSGFLCSDTTTALECQVGVWVSLPCRGPNGCKREGDTVSCDMSANLEGDACASSAEGKGLCSADGLATLECRGNSNSSGATLVKTNTCRTCSIADDKVTCQH